MGTKYFCAHCDEEFSQEEPSSRPRCPRCMRRGGVEQVRQEPETHAKGRRWAVIALVVLAIAGVGYGVYRNRTVTLEATPPLRPLSPKELGAYIERERAQAGAYATMLALPSEVRGWPESPVEVSHQMHEASSRWSLEHALTRSVFTAEQTLAAMSAQEGRRKLYPLEMAAATTALLRQRGLRAMVAEVWELPGEQAPPDPSGMLGYFVTAVFETGSDEASLFLDPWGGRSPLDATSARVLRDTEVVGAALGIEAARVFAKSGDASEALPMIETALSLDPVSPTLRIVHATVLIESGGLPQALAELQAAVELRPDGPRQLHLVQLTLAEAGMLQASGQTAAAQTRFADANRVVVEVIEQWPRYGRAHLTLATIHLGLEDTERARLELEAAERSSPESPMLWAVWSQYHLARDDPDSATVAIRRALELDPENWQLRMQASSVFAAAGDRDEARAQADEALRWIAPAGREALESYLDDLMESEEEEKEATAPASTAEPALMLGDPSKLRLRGPGEELKLDLDETR